MMLHGVQVECRREGELSKGKEQETLGLDGAQNWDDRC
jgi:hypothetical protein